ncbi:MAG TPA: permease, partial [Victivallales bacterium]|nr:permease [Victivallales bacterium]
CLVPAFFIAGAIGVFVSQASVMKYLGQKANKIIAYGVASVSGTMLAVCSCTVLPLFAGIYKMGAGLGPACTFLYSGPAINVLAIVLTARILGMELGIARAVGSILFSVVIGALMHFIFRKDEADKKSGMMKMPEPEIKRHLWQNALYFAAMVGILVFANWGSPNNYIFELKDGSSFNAAVVSAPEDSKSTDAEYEVKMLNENSQGKEISIRLLDVKSMTPVPGVWTEIWKHKWHVTAIFAVLFGMFLCLWFSVPIWKVVASGVAVAIFAIAVPSGGLWVLFPFAMGVLALSWITLTGNDELQEWFSSSWTFAKQILPLLLGGVVVAGFLLGRVGHEGIIPSEWVAWAVGGNSVRANFLASFVGAFMYFATLTEVPILQGLIGSGMGKGPALALLLAGPALSLPNMLVIRNIMGTKKTIVFVSLVILLATLSGIVFGALG